MSVVGPCSGGFVWGGGAWWNTGAGRRLGSSCCRRRRRVGVRVANRGVRMSCSSSVASAPPEVQQFVGRLHGTGRMKLVMATTGAGSRAIPWLLGEAGASNTVLEGVVPYGRSALRRLLSPSPLVAPAGPGGTDGSGTGDGGLVTAEVSIAMAEACALRAGALFREEGHAVEEDDPELVGVGCTAAIATSRARRGDNKFFVSVATADTLYTSSCVLEKGARTRAEEDELVARAILQALQQAVAPPAPGDEESRVQVGLREGEQLHFSTQSRRPMDLVAKMRSGSVKYVLVDADGRTASSVRGFQGLVLPGSFNPLHRGHTGMMAAARCVVSRDLPTTATNPMHCAYEMSIHNADKPSLSDAEVARRLAQFRDVAPVVLTTASLFTGKLPLLPGCTFVVGSDTAKRILTPRYYGGEEDMIRELQAFQRTNTNFLVAGRVRQAPPSSAVVRNASGGHDHAHDFLTLEDIEVPTQLQTLFRGIPQVLFRMDISSTQLRREMEEAEHS